MEERTCRIPLSAHEVVEKHKARIESAEYAESPASVLAKFLVDGLRGKIHPETEAGA